MPEHVVLTVESDKSTPGRSQHKESSRLHLVRPQVIEMTEEKVN